MGALSNPSIPRLRGIERFRGGQFHSARWDHGVDLRGKRVAVIGTGASAIQFVPQIQPAVAKLFLLQRTPPWVLPKPDRAYTAWEKAAFAAVPGLRWLHRQWIYARLEGRVVAFEHPALMRMVEKEGRRHIARGIRDPALRDRLTPRYTPGCKRILLSNDYYPALAQPNVEVLADEVAEVGEASLALAGGRTLEVTPSSTAPDSRSTTTWAASTSPGGTAPCSPIAGSTAPRRTSARRSRASRTCSP